jgi:hypothetical protein
MQMLTTVTSTNAQPVRPDRTAVDGPVQQLVHIAPWVDPVVDRRGHDPRSSYVETFWLATLGPTAAWLLRRLAAGLDRHPDGFDLDLCATARSLGLSYSKGLSSPFGKAFGRCIMFGLAHQRSDGYAVRRRLPQLTRRHLERLPESLQAEHERWLGAAGHLALDALERAHSLAAAMLAAGDDPAVVESQLVAVGVPAPTAAEAVELVRAANRDIQRDGGVIQ